MNSFPHETWGPWVIKFTVLQWFWRLSQSFIMKPVSTPKGTSLFSVHLCCLPLGRHSLTHFHHITARQLPIILYIMKADFFHLFYAPLTLYKNYNSRYCWGNCTHRHWNTKPINKNGWTTLNCSWVKSFCSIHLYLQVFILWMRWESQEIS